MRRLPGPLCRWRHVGSARIFFGRLSSQRAAAPVAAITAATIAAGWDRRGKTPFQARHFLDAMRGLFAWAQEAQFVKSNPAAEVKYPLLKSGARAANNGATVAALHSIFGWSGSKMASLYTANADRARLSREHMDKMRTNYAAPMGKVRRETSKGKKTVA